MALMRGGIIRGPIMRSPEPVVVVPETLSIRGGIYMRPAIRGAVSARPALRGKLGMRPA